MDEDFIDERKPARRFELATESVARSRLDGFRDTVKKFQKQHPEVLGATIFGSMIRGDKAKASSDVDAFLYVDADTLPSKDRTQEAKTLEDQYHSGLLKELGVSGEEAKKLYGDLIPKLLSSEILDQNIKNNVEDENEYLAFREKRREVDTSTMSQEEKDKFYAEEPEKKRAIDNFEIGGMFHARVGSGVEKYRKMFLEKLIALPDRKMAERIWRGVYAQISTMEGGDKKRKLPQTLEDALQTYHPELYRTLIQAKDQERIDDIRENLQGLYSNEV